LVLHYRVRYLPRNASDEKRLQLLSRAGAVSLKKFGSMTKFIAFAVDSNGTMLARYDLVATEKEAAEQEARQYLDRHQVIEVWSDDHRRVARIVRA
jgi:hypothetical protein